MLFFILIFTALRWSFVASNRRRQYQRDGVTLCALTAAFATDDIEMCSTTFPRRVWGSIQLMQIKLIYMCVLVATLMITFKGNCEKMDMMAILRTKYLF